jgi:hypothetical protein
MTTAEQHDIDAAPELAALDLEDKPDGPAAAAMVAAGVGIFVLGLLTTLAVPWAGLKGFLADFQLRQGVGPLAGKTTLAVLAWAASWGVLHYRWRERDVDLRRFYKIGFILGVLGAIGTFPPFFERF